MRGWCPAERVNVAFLGRRPDWRTYIVRALREMIADEQHFVCAKGTKGCQRANNSGRDAKHSIERRAKAMAEKRFYSQPCNLPFPSEQVL